MEDFKSIIETMILHRINPIHALWNSNTMNTKMKKGLQKEFARAIIDWFSKSDQYTKSQILNAIKVVECDKINENTANYIILATNYTARVAEMLDMELIWNLNYSSDSDNYSNEYLDEYSDKYSDKYLDEYLDEYSDEDPNEYLSGNYKNFENSLVERIVYIKDTLCGDGIYATKGYDRDEINNIENMLESIKLDKSGIIVVRCDPTNNALNSIYYWRETIENLYYCNIIPGNENWSQYVDLESNTSILVYEYDTQK